MRGLNGKEVDVKDVTYTSSTQQVIKDIGPQQEPNKVVYVSMQHSIEPIKVFDLKVFESLFGPVYIPDKDGLELQYIDSRYRDTVVLRFSHLIDRLNSIYFQIAGDIFSLLGIDGEDETLKRGFGLRTTRKNFIFLLQNALAEYSRYDGKKLYTKLKWLLPIDVDDIYINKSSSACLRKFKFVPNWVEWMRGDPDITSERVVLPFKFIYNQDVFPLFGDSARFSQDYATQSFYTYYTGGDETISYICEYPFMFGVAPDGDFTEASAIFELKDTILFEKVFARIIATHVKRNLSVVQLPGNLASYNFDEIIQALNEEIEPIARMANTEFISGFWNYTSASK